LTTQPPVPADNRRAIVRIVGYEMVRIASSMAKMHGDVIEYLIFTAIWVANSSHLIGDERYSELRSIPPDKARRPVTLEELQRTIPMPDDILRTYVERMIAKDMVEHAPGGLIVPTAVFTQPEMLNGTNELYSGMVNMVTAMRAAGFAFGEDA
jgi:hypothetical protein